MWAVHHCSVGPPSTTTSGLFTAWLLCRSLLPPWSPPARSNFGWSLLRRCWRGLQVFSAGAPGSLLSLRPRLHHWYWISWSPASPRCVVLQMQVCLDDNGSTHRLLKKRVNTDGASVPSVLTGTPFVFCFVCLFVTLWTG